MGKPLEITKYLKPELTKHKNFTTSDV